MFNDIKKKLDNWLKSRWGKGKSFTEYRTKAMDLLEQHPSFKNLSSINKSKLMSAMDIVIGRKKSVEASAPIKSIIDTAKLIKEATWENNIPGVQKSLVNALKPLSGTKLHKEKVSKINGIIKALNVKNYEASILKIEGILKEIIADDKAINRSMNARMNELQTKISSFNKISDFAKMKVEGSRVISNIRSISKALTKSIGKENKEIINKILTAANGLKKSNAKERIPVIIEALNELYFKELMSNKKTTQMASVIKSLREKRDERNRQKKELAEIKAKVTQQIRKATFALRDLGIKQYSYSEVQRLVAKVRDANSDPKSPNYIGKVSFKISNIFRTAEERGRRKNYHK